MAQGRWWITFIQLYNWMWIEMTLEFEILLLTLLSSSLTTGCGLKHLSASNKE
jgi:hypothetical protein